MIAEIKSALVRLGALLRPGLLIALVLPGAAASAELTLAVSRSTLSLPFFVADAQGYFQSEGAQVKLEECLGGRRCVQRLFDGGVQFATASDLPIMFNSFARSDFAVVATFVTSSKDLKLIARRSAGITEAQHLHGKRIGTVKGASAHYFLDAFLLFNDIDPRRVQMVDLAPEQIPAALQRREVDAVAIWEPYGWLALRAAGDDAVVLPSPRIYTESFNLLVTRHFLKEREDDVVRILRALARAQAFIAARPQDAQNILKQRLGLDEQFVRWVWGDLNFRLALDQSLITTLEAEARWALREGNVQPAQAVPNYLRFVEPGPLRKVLPASARILQ